MISRRRFVALSLASGVTAALPPHALAEAFIAGAIAGASSLRAHAAAQGLLVGAAVNISMLRNDPIYAKVLAEQYNLVVAENAMKWAALRPAADRYDFTGADALVAFAEAHQMKIRGHNFVWHEAIPPWFAGTVTPNNAQRVLTDHIHTVGRRYAGKMHSWDVVNEAIDTRSGRPDNLRDSPWLSLLGPGYLEMAFRAAREADPHALLTYNDHGIEYDTPDDVQKREAVLALLRQLKAANVPIDAVGIQSHLSAGTKNPLGPGIRTFTQQAAAMGLQIFVTELDVNDDQVAADDYATRDQAIADVYRDYMTAMVTEPAVKAALTWGITDKATWLNQTKTHLAAHPNRPQRPLLFDDDYRPSAAFFALREAIDRRQLPCWGTPACWTGTTVEAGVPR